jgi:hypothetical protein
MVRLRLGTTFRGHGFIGANPVAQRSWLTGWAEEKVWKPTKEKSQENMVDGTRLELATSALRTRRSPN